MACLVTGLRRDGAVHLNTVAGTDVRWAVRSAVKVEEAHSEDIAGHTRVELGERVIAAACKGNLADCMVESKGVEDWPVDLDMAAVRTAESRHSAACQWDLTPGRRSGLLTNPGPAPNPGL